VTNYVADTTETYDDGLDNQIAWYRIGCKTGDYVAGTIAVSLELHHRLDRRRGAHHRLHEHVLVTPR
jgi:hypothetical protein